MLIIHHTSLKILSFKVGQRFVSSESLDIMLFCSVPEMTDNDFTTAALSHDVLSSLKTGCQVSYCSSILLPANCPFVNILKISFS